VAEADQYALFWFHNSGSGPILHKNILMKKVYIVTIIIQAVVSLLMLVYALIQKGLAEEQQEISEVNKLEARRQQQLAVAQMVELNKRMLQIDSLKTVITQLKK
jgi:hypothetical protein